jgi:hypothetical protein
MLSLRFGYSLPVVTGSGTHFADQDNRRTSSLEKVLLLEVSGQCHQSERYRNLRHRFRLVYATAVREATPDDLTCHATLVESNGELHCLG